MSGNAKDAVATMGALLPNDAGGRDAVHVAVFSAVSSEKLMPGQDVALNTQGDADCEVSASGAHIGIVDPFLKGAATPGSRFWVYLYPRSITGLSHRWSHPAFGEGGGSYATPSAQLASEQWLRDFCASNNNCPSYDTIIRAVSGEQWQEDGYGDAVQWDGEYLHFNGSDAHGEIPREFWDHIETVIGRKVPHRSEYFSCSC